MLYSQPISKRFSDAATVDHTVDCNAALLNSIFSFSLYPLWILALVTR